MNNPLVDQINSVRRKRQMFVFATVSVLLVSLTHIASVVVGTYL
jgi:hypothetical protein